MGRMRELLSEGLPYRDDLLRVAKNFSVQDADDILQDVFLYLWENDGPLDDLGDGALIKYYLLKLVTWQGIARYRTKERESRIQQALATAASLVDGPKVDAKIEVDQLLAQLSPRQAMALGSIGIEGMTMGEAGHMMGISPQAVGQLAVRALRILRRNNG